VEFRDIERRPVVQQVAEQLREAVVHAVRNSSQLPPETSLSQALTVSRPTLREALRILEAEGLITRDTRTSAVRPDARAPAMSRPLKSALTVLNKTERISLADIMDLRAAIEERAARRAAEVATPEDLRLMKNALDEGRLAAETGEGYDEASYRFHVAMVMASHNEAFLLVMLAAREAAADLLEHAAQVARQRRGGQADPPPSGLHERAVASHLVDVQTTIYDAIRAGRGDDAAAIVMAAMHRLFAPLLTTTDDDPHDCDS
jgi:GntR family transcriptional regulator, transcriptional repressor for pyruvate dehydrogenase complex